MRTGTGNNSVSFRISAPTLRGIYRLQVSAIHSRPDNNNNGSILSPVGGAVSALIHDDSTWKKIENPVSDAFANGSTVDMKKYEKYLGCSYTYGVLHASMSSIVSVGGHQTSYG